VVSAIAFNLDEWLPKTFMVAPLLLGSNWLFCKPRLLVFEESPAVRSRRYGGRA
jgi:hypothetical protein